jgi:hypothetical protein
MKRTMSYTASIMGLAIGSLAATAFAQTTATGPYYAAPSWDQTLSCTTLATCPRFIVLSNFNSAAVLDRETGLVWERTPGAGTRQRFEAIRYCLERQTGGRMGWRVPKAEELFSLIDPSAIGPFDSTSPAALPAGHPFANVADNFMATSAIGPPFLSSGRGYVAVSIQSGVIQTTGTGDLYRTWCVRSAGGDGPVF